MLGSDTMAAGRFFDVVWYDLSVTKRKAHGLPHRYSGEIKEFVETHSFSVSALDIIRATKADYISGDDVSGREEEVVRDGKCNRVF